MNHKLINNMKTTLHSDLYFEILQQPVLHFLYQDGYQSVTCDYQESVSNS